MITPLRSTERRYLQQGRQDIWLTFFSREHRGPPASDFGVLTAFDELRLPPRAVSLPYPEGEAEVLTYVYRGVLAQEDSTGSSRVLHAGEFQRMVTGGGVRHKEANASRRDWAHVFRMSLRPLEAGLDRAQEQRRFAAAQRHNLLCVVASPGGRKGSLRILQDALVCSIVLDPGHHLIHELLPGRSAWVHIVCGEASMEDVVLSQGDGAGVTTETAVSLTALEDSEILLVDSGPGPKSFADVVAP